MCKFARRPAVGCSAWLDPLCSMSIDVDLAVYINPIVALLSDDFFGDRREPRSAYGPNSRLLNESVGGAGNYLDRAGMPAPIEVKAELQAATYLLKILCQLRNDRL